MKRVRGNGGIDRFSSLPEGCISEIISLTSPRDACSSSAISRGFKSAADSDHVWDKFLPADYREIIARSVSPVVFPNKKQLYMGLCDSPILLDGGKMSFALDKQSGKKCYMLQARELSITWGDTPRYWRWMSLPESRFSEVAQLLKVCWLDIGGKIKTRMLSPKTIYAAYLVFKIAEDNYGLVSVPVKASVRLVGERGEETEDETSTIYFRLGRSRPGPSKHNERRPEKRRDGWLEIEMGEFFNDQGDEDHEVEMRLMEIKQLNWKSGLIVQGMELRPKELDA